jgi:hypothetical protein
MILAAYVLAATWRAGNETSHWRWEWLGIALQERVIERSRIRPCPQDSNASRFLQSGLPRSDSSMAGVGSSSTPLLDIEGSVH